MKPGQKYPTPTRGFGDRVFYETLLRQKPDSFMAQEWCVNYGVLSEKEAAKLYKTVIKRKGRESLPSSMKGKRKSSSAGKKKKKKALILNDDDDGIGVGTSTTDEGIGAMVI